MIIFFLSAALLRSHFLGDRQVLSFMCTFCFKPQKLYFLGIHFLLWSELNISSNATYLFQLSFLKYNTNIFFLTREETCVFLCYCKRLFWLRGSCRYFSCTFLSLCIFVFDMTITTVLCIGSPLQLIKKYIWVFPLAGKDHEKILYI